MDLIWLWGAGRGCLGPCWILDPCKALSSSIYNPLCRLANGLEGVRIESKGRLSTLTFFNVSEKDYGNYTCVATNKLGNTNASIILYGRYPKCRLCPQTGDLSHCCRPAKGGEGNAGGQQGEGFCLHDSVISSFHHCL